MGVFHSMGCIWTHMWREYYIFPYTKFYPQKYLFKENKNVSMCLDDDVGFSIK